MTREQRRLAERLADRVSDRGRFAGAEVGTKRIDDVSELAGPKRKRKRKKKKRDAMEMVAEMRDLEY